MFTSTQRTRPYHHGDLPAAILDAADRQVAVGGMEGLVAREIARTAGVSPAALYRHFPDLEHLRAATSRRARERLAARMIAAREAVPAAADAGVTARLRFRAIARAYLAFAVEEPGRFDAAFGRCAVTTAGADDPDAWTVLGETLDELVASGLLDPAQRAAAPLVAWTSVHGLAVLLVKGAQPAGLTPEAAAETVIAGIEHALHLATSMASQERSR